MSDSANLVDCKSEKVAIILMEWDRMVRMFDVCSKQASMTGIRKIVMYFSRQFHMRSR